MKWLFLFFLALSMVCEAAYIPIVNPSTGKPDYVTLLTSATLPSGSTQYIQNTSTLQSGATFYVSSGTVNTLNAGSIKWSDGTIQVSSPTASTGGVVGSGIVSPGTFTWVNNFGMALSTATVGGAGGVYSYAVGSGNGTLGFNSTSDNYSAGVNGLGGLLQFTLADGKLIYYNESSVTAGNPHGHTVALTVDGSRRLGLGTTSPASVLDVIGSTSDAMEVRFSTTTTMYHVAISTSGHLLSQGRAPTITSCGTAPDGVVVGNDITGRITIGGGVAVLSCTLTFSLPYETNAPECMVNDESNILFAAATTTSTTMTVRVTANFAGDTVSYFCFGRQ